MKPILFLIINCMLWAQSPEKLTFDRIFNSAELTPKQFGPARWLENGYTTLESTDKGNEIVFYETKSATRHVQVSVSQLTPKGMKQPLRITDYQWSSDKRTLLLFTNTTRVWRDHTMGDYWVLKIKSGELRKLGRAQPESSLMFAKFSPDNKRVGYVSKNNIYIESLEDHTIKQLTDDGSETIINGTSDWAYEEEFGLRDCFQWSPDGLKIAYWQFDTEGIGTFNMINNTDSIYPKLIPLQYPKVGTTNSACRVGIISSEGGKTTWFKVEGDLRNNYIPRMEWAANSNEVLIQRMNRLQNTNTLLMGNAATGDVNSVFSETEETWVDIHDDLKWFNKGEHFTWLSERDGWRHLYLVSRDGKETKLLTPGNYDIINILRIDERSGWVYFIASPENATQRYLYRVGIDGSGKFERLTPDSIPGTHRYQISTNADFAFHTFQSTTQPPIISLVSLPDHKTVRLLETNQNVREAFLKIDQSPVEFFKVPLENKVALDAFCIKPPNFDPSKKYPVLFYVYGEPAGQTVLDRWGWSQQLWYLMLAQQGYVIFSVDNRGTPAPKGRDWRKIAYGKIGIIAPEDQAAATTHILNTRPYLDKNRVGIWGWSGGGSMTLNMMFKYPDIYKTGVSVAPVSDQTLYNAIYQERYMGLPSTNPEGYKNGSPITFAHQLKGHLMVIHGTGDDNVHYQSFERLVNKLIEHNKMFSMMSYPNRSHGIYEGKNTRRHLFETITRYLDANLKEVEAVPNMVYDREKASSH